MKVLFSNTNKFPLLEVLYINKNEINDAGLLSMRGARMEFLKELNLSILKKYLGENNIGTKGIKLLIKAELPSL